jgi:GntR family transcriptional regulator
MAVHIDPDSPEHPYLQLAGILRERVRAGEYTGPLPSLTQLTTESGLSLGSVQRAIRVLVDEGVIFTVPGRGVFVRKAAGPPRP